MIPLKTVSTAVAVAVCAALASCSSDGGSSSDTPPTETGYSRSELLTDTVPAGSSKWITIPDMDTSGGAVNELVLDSDGPVYVRALKSGSTLFYDYDATTGVVTYSDGLPFPIWPYCLGVSVYENKTAGLTLPPLHTAADSFPSGSYTLKIENQGSADATVRINLARKTDSDFSTGSLAINLFIYTPSGMENSVIPSEAEAENVKQYMSEIFSQAGVTVDGLTVSFVDDPGASQLSTESDMVAFFERVSHETAGRTDAGVNCFLVPDLPAGILGMDGAIPGPAFVHGTSASGVIAQIKSYGFKASGHTVHETDQRFLAKILAHEIGHYLGLFHTSESDGTTHDPIDDTPECPSSSDTDGDGAVTGPECRGSGAEYLMFWTVDTGLVHSGDFQTQLSPHEGEVVNTHPSVL